MKRSIVTVPAHVMRHLSVNWDIDWRGRGAGDATSGLTRTVYDGFPRWTGSPEIFVRKETLRLWRAVRAQAQGRRNIYRIEMVDPVGFRPQETGASTATIRDGLPFGNGATFASGAGWRYAPFALAVGAHAKGAEEMRVDVESCGGVAPKVGQIMSHDDWPFTVTWVQPVGGTVYDIGVQMPLRAAVRDSDPVLMRGVGRFEAAEEGMGNPSHGPALFSRPQLSFREVLAR